MPFASHDDRFPEILKRGLWGCQIVIPPSDILLKNFFGGISCWVKRVKCVSKPVIKHGKRGYLFLCK